MKRNLTMRDLRAAARRLSPQIEIEDDHESLYAYAPPGFSWAGETGLHYFTAYYRGDRVWRREAIADIIDRMEAGIEPCEIAGCDICEEAKQ